MYVGLYNSTDTVELAEQLRGRNLVAASSVVAVSAEAIALRARYTVDDTTARTFRLRFRSAAADTTATIRGDATGGVLMTIMEIAA